LIKDNVSDLAYDAYEKLGIIGTLVAMGGTVIRWLVARLKESEKRERDLSEKRSSDMRKFATMVTDQTNLLGAAFKELEESMRDNTRSQEYSVERITRSLDALGKECDTLKNQVLELEKASIRCSRN